MSIVKRISLVLAIVLSCVGCDQTTKSVASEHLPAIGELSFLGDTVRLQLAHNYGAFLSWGDSIPEAWRDGIFSFGIGAVLFALLVYLCSRVLRNIATVLGLSLFLGGGLGNLVDRLWNGGYVVDFISIGIGGLRTGIFNFATLSISGGTTGFGSSTRRASWNSLLQKKASR